MVTCIQNDETQSLHSRHELVLYYELKSMQAFFPLSYTLLIGNSNQGIQATKLFRKQILISWSKRTIPLHEEILIFKVLMASLQAYLLNFVKPMREVLTSHSEWISWKIFGKPPMKFF